MLRHTKYRPYVRRLRPGDKSADLRTAMRLAFFELKDRSGYVMVQHGWPNRVIVGPCATRREVMDSVVGVAIAVRRGVPMGPAFRGWARGLQRRASGGAAR